MVTIPAAVAFAGLVYFALSSTKGLDFTDALIAFGAGAMLCLWCWLALFVIKLFFRRKSPLVIVENDGLRMPHTRPEFIAWEQIASVEQVKSGRIAYLRLRLVSPNDYLSYVQRFVRSPYGDSILLTLGFDKSASDDVAFFSIKEVHSKHHAQ